MQQLIPNPSEGKVRALFQTGKGTVKTMQPRSHSKNVISQQRPALLEAQPSTLARGGDFYRRSQPPVGNESS